MPVVERVAGGTAGCATTETGLIEMLDHRRMSQLMVGFERQQVIAAACQDSLGNRRLAPSAGFPPAAQAEPWPASPMASKVTMLFCSASWPSNSGTAVISFDLPVHAAPAQHQALLAPPCWHSTRCASGTLTSFA